MYTVAQGSRSRKRPRPGLSHQRRDPERPAPNTYPCAAKADKAKPVQVFTVVANGRGRAAPVDDHREDGEGKTITSLHTRTHLMLAPHSASPHTTCSRIHTDYSGSATTATRRSTGSTASLPRHAYSSVTLKYPKYNQIKVNFEI